MNEMAFTTKQRYLRAAFFSAGWLGFWALSSLTFQTWAKYWSWFGILSTPDNQSNAFWNLGVWCFPLLLLLFIVLDRSILKNSKNSWLVQYFPLLFLLVTILLYPVASAFSLGALMAYSAL